MDSTTMTDIIIFAILMAILWNVLDMRREQRTTAKVLNIVTNTLKEVAAYVDHSNEKEANTIRAINEMCEVLNKSYDTQSDYMNRSAFALANIVACMIPFIDDIKKRAIENENYEKAHECMIILKNLQQIVNHTNHE